MGTFQNLAVLQTARETAQLQLKEKYTSTVKTFVDTIRQTMKFRNINHFEAMKFIQDETTLSNKPEQKIMFAAALIELVEDINFGI